MNLCTDTDLLLQDPSIFSRAGLAAQTLLSGTGDLAGTLFTLDAGMTSFTTARVRVGHVLQLTGATIGAYPIVSVDSGTTLIVSATHVDLFPLTASPVTVPVGTGNDLPFVVRTFAPQARLVGDLILRSAGVDDSDLDRAKVLNTTSTARLAATGTLALVYAALASVATDPKDLLAASMRCEGFFRRSFNGFRIRIDTDNDGVANIVRTLGTVALARV